MVSSFVHSAREADLAASTGIALLPTSPKPAVHVVEASRSTLRRRRPARVLRPASPARSSRPHDPPRTGPPSTACRLPTPRSRRAARYGWPNAPRTCSGSATLLPQVLVERKWLRGRVVNLRRKGLLEPVARGMAPRLEVLHGPVGRK